MESVFQISAICVVTALLCAILKRTAPEQALLLVIAAVTGVLLAVTPSVRTLMQFFEELSNRTGVTNELFLPLYKMIGIAFVVRIGSGICRDAGESALASVLDTAGTICALLAAMPLLRAVFALLMEFLE